MSDTDTPPVKRKRRWGRIARRIAFWALGVVLLLPFLAIGVVLAAANTGFGRGVIERETSVLTGGTVILQGLSGRFPDSLRLAHAELRDAKGAWLSLDDVALDWSPTALIGRDAHVEKLTVARLAMPRLPLPSPASAKKPASQGGFSLPVRVDIDQLDAARVELGAPVALRPAVLALQGAAHLASLQQGKADITITRIDGPGTYQLAGSMGDAGIDAHVTAQEPPGGFIGGLARLPGLGAIALDATIDGPRSAEHTVLSLKAGALSANANGAIDLVHQAASLDLQADAPAMAPRQDLSWSGTAVQAHVQGPFAKPDVNAHAVITALEGGGASIATLTLDASGNRGAVQAKTVLTGLVIPGPKPDLFAAAPLSLTADARLDDKTIPIKFRLEHPLVTADGTGNAGGDIAVQIHTVVPDLAPLAALGHADIRGSTQATAKMAVHGGATEFSLDGTADFTGGQAPVPTLLGKTSYGATARLAGQDITISRAEVDGKALQAALTGTDTASGFDLAWTLALSDLALASPQLRGALTANGHVQGPQTRLTVQADIRGRIGTSRIPEGPLQVSLSALNVPASPSGTVQASGSFAGAPVTLAASLDRAANGAFHAKITRAAWKSFAAEADMTLPQGASLPEGSLTARMTRLADLAPVLHQPIAGAVNARVTTTSGANPAARIALDLNDLAAGGASVGRGVVMGTLRDPAGKTPDVNLSMALTGIAAAKAQGVAHLTATGPLSALALRADTNLQVQGAPATLTAAALLDVPAHSVTVQSLAANYKGEPLRLAAPAHIVYGAKTAIDTLRIALGNATVMLAGSVSPTLDLTASLRNVTPDLAKPFAPGIDAAGLLTADARLTGSLAAPAGTIRLSATGLRMRTGPAASVPAASLQANATLGGGAARVDAHVNAGPKLHLAADGAVPIIASGAIALQVSGGFDLSLINPILNAGGRRAAGTISLDARIGGTTAAPRIDGGVRLAGGEIQDFVQGLRIEKIAAQIDAVGDTVSIRNFTGEAGPGTIAITGTIGVTAPGMPVDLHVRANNARPLASDLLTAFLDADIGIKGEASGNLRVGGKVLVRNAEINIPNGLPPSIATLNVRYPGEKPKPPAPAKPPAELALDLVVDAPSNVFVRGHGLDAELGGRLTIGGRATAPQIGGGFDMRRGSISVAGTTLTFSRGKIGFDGTSVTNKIDPTLDFVADSTSQSVTATLAVGGYADAPKITLSSVPDLPQDEVLAHLLFQRSVKDLSAVQIAEIAAALAELSGVTGGGGDPLAAVRKGLGLDRLSVGGAAGNSNGATVEAGRYVARGVFVGAKQNTSGGTAAEVQVDLTKRLKLTSQLATGGGSVQGATPDNDPGSTVGLSYGFDY